MIEILRSAFSEGYERNLLDFIW